MTRLFSSAAMAAIAAAALGAAPALAQQGYHHAMSSGCMPGKLSVTGEGEARVAPDMATISLGVTTQADTADAAMEENSEKQNAVVEALAQSGVADSDIQTSGLMLTPMINYGNQEAGPNITGYQAQNMVTVRVHDLAELGSVLDAIVQAGANELHGINFTREDSNGAEDQARMSAVEDAMNRAEVMARAAGRELGPILTMGEPPMPPVGPEPMMMRLEAASADSAGVPVSAGEISLMSRVAMEFVLLPAEGEACAMPMRGGPDAGPGDARGPGERPRSRPARDGAAPAAGGAPAAAAGEAPAAAEAPAADGETAGQDATGAILEAPQVGETPQSDASTDAGTQTGSDAASENGADTETDADAAPQPGAAPATSN